MKLVTTISVLFGNLIYMMSPINEVNLNRFSKYMGCYPGWGYSQATQDFKEQYKGNIAKLESKKNCKGALSDKTDLDFIDPRKNPQFVLEYMNIYRDTKGITKLIYDDEACNIAKRYAISKINELNFKFDNYKDICPYCSKVGMTQARDYSRNSELISAWINDEESRKNMDDPAYKFGCAESNEGKVVFIFSNKSSSTKLATPSSNIVEDKNAVTMGTSTSKEVVVTGVNSSKGVYVECLGPDGKILKLDQTKCDEFNSAWNKKPAGVQPSAQSQNTQTQKTSQKSYSCWDNTYKYFYYTTSGEQCNADNQKSRSSWSCSEIANIEVHKPCLDECSKVFTNNSNICIQAYMGLGAIIEDNRDLYTQCDYENKALLQKCNDLCLSKYKEAQSKCN